MIVDLRADQQDMHGYSEFKRDDYQNRDCFRTIPGQLRPPLGGRWCSSVTIAKYLLSGIRDFTFN